MRGVSFHAVEYHLLHVPNVSKARWSHDEHVLVAREEIQLREAVVTNVNFELAASFMQRLLDAIKCIRPHLPRGR